jgi:hypothetical protein
VASSLKWYASNVKATFERPIQDGLTNVAMLTRRQARRNLTENGQIDTKFLWNGVYVATPDKVTSIPPDGKYRSLKTGYMVRREAGPIVQPKDSAYVGVAAAYAIYLELQNSFLYRALEQVQGRQAEQAMVGLGTGIIVPDSFEVFDE